MWPSKNFLRDAHRGLRIPHAQSPAQGKDLRRAPAECLSQMSGAGAVLAGAGCQTPRCRLVKRPRPRSFLIAYIALRFFKCASLPCGTSPHPPVPRLLPARAAAPRRTTGAGANTATRSTSHRVIEIPYWTELRTTCTRTDPQCNIFNQAGRAGAAAYLNTTGVFGRRPRAGLPRRPNTHRPSCT